ncbi:hypothetical protein SEA_CHUPACABRA_42 [Mycobacterium phage Chupacabra]|uniref:Uncharacterized protein n=3 Tax=Fromanvirus goose TaxID=1211282 RepID=A0A291AV08_9CAUD|nr:hypothetical protein FGG46_gp51 [Mycobacterium phage Goose]AFU20711.1 hypothetical protein GOOSE_43 [Mycobacterium phage Goose]ATE84785.1 hypothetical protein OKCENTRAL2016_42 [Mycobacterium phage OKCentral2016]QHB41225.1 hypothetical protein SEA_CHUPACABRA_42 [Mycobacterium phage Chupacabra]
MRIQLMVDRERGASPLVVTADIEGFELVDSPEYREYLFDATVEAMVNGVKDQGLLA